MSFFVVVFLFWFSHSFLLGPLGEGLLPISRAAQFLQPLQVWALGVLGAAELVGHVPSGISDGHWVVVGCGLVGPGSVGAEGAQNYSPCHLGLGSSGCLV